MARPKSTKPTKSKKISARLTEADYMKIKAVYGSIQAFLDLMVKALPILILVSCNPPLESNNPESPSETFDTIGSMKSGFTNLNINTALGADIVYKCNSMRCYLTGDLYSLYNNTTIKSTIVNNAIMEIQGAKAYGEICLSNGQCYDGIFKIGQELVIETETKCLGTINQYNQSEFNAFLNFRYLTTGSFNFIGNSIGQCSAFN